MKKFNIKSFIKTYQHQERGATAVEFGIVAFAAMGMLFAIIESGYMMWNMTSVQYAVEETARYASINPDSTEGELEDYAEERVSAFLVKDNNINITKLTSTSNDVDFIELQATIQLSPMSTAFLPGDFASFQFQTNVKKPILE